MKWTPIALLGLVLLGGTLHAADACCCCFSIPQCWRAPLTAQMNTTDPRCHSWWSKFNDPTLAYLINRLTEQNLDLQIAARSLCQCNSEANQQEYRRQWVSLSAEAARTYIELRMLQARFCIISANIFSYKDTHSLTESLLVAGFANSIEQLQANEQLKALEAEKPQIAIAIQKNIHRLSVLLGYPPGELFCLLCPPKPLPSVPCSLPVGTPCILVQNKPEILKAEAEVEAGIQPYEAYHKAVLEGLEEVENALVAFRLDEMRNQKLNEAAYVSRTAYDQVRQLYGKGLKNYLEVQLINRSHLSAQLSQLQGQTDLLLDYIALYKALGGGW